MDGEGEILFSSTAFFYFLNISSYRLLLFFFGKLVSQIGTFLSVTLLGKLASQIQDFLYSFSLGQVG